MKNASNQPTENRGSQLAGTLWMIAMGLFVAGLGLIFIWYLWAVYKKASLMDDWVETPCLIEKSEIDDSDLNQHYGTKYKLVISYRYRYENRDYVGEKFRRIQPESSHRSRIESKLAPYPVGTDTVCYVNPDEPTAAVLQKDPKASLYSIWFPGLFVLGGIGLIISVLRRKPRD